MNRIFIIFLILGMSISFCNAEEWLTIYNDDLSLIRSQFDLDLEKGAQSYNFDQITSRIEPASVIVIPMKDPVIIAEQNYEYDLAGTPQILQKYIEREVNLILEDQASYTGIMKFFDGQSIGIIEKNTNKLILIQYNQVQLIRLAELPANFYTKPTLHWNLIADKKGKFPLQLSYLSGGFSWDVTYNTVWDGKTLILNSWVTIDNRSGKAFDNVNLKLIAGEINKIRNQYNRYKMSEDTMAMQSTGAGRSAPSFEEKAFHDFHLYTLDQKVSFANNQTKQIQLFPTKKISAEGILEYNSFGDGVRSLIMFENKADKGLGIPLPKGIIKVYKEDTDKNLEFIGEDSIQHTGRNEKVRITTGKAFDIVGKSLVVDSKSISQRVSERTIQITLRNNSTEKKSIVFVHQLNANSRIVSTQPTLAVDSELKANLTVEVMPDKEYVFRFIERTEY